MSIATDAQAVQVFPNETVTTPYGDYNLRVLMLAIGGAESNWNDSGKGDWYYGGSTCDGSTSWGWLQIHNVHSAYLIQHTGSTNPCVWEQWLFNPDNCAKAALAVYEGQGLGAWTTYTKGKFLPYIKQAEQALGASSTSTNTVSPQQASWALPVSVGLLLGAVYYYSG